MKQKKHSEISNSDLLQKLKENVYNKFGRNVTNHFDCVQLSQLIFDKYNIRLGITTLRRFFGIDMSKSNPSIFTLDGISQFAGYKNWFDFVKKNQTIELKARSQLDYEKLMEFSYNSIKVKNIEYFDNIIINEKLHSLIIDFIHSDSYYMPLVTGPGFGKSTSIAKVIKYCFDHKEFNNYEPLLFNADFINSINSIGFDFLKFLMSLVNCGKQTTKDIHINEQTIIIIDSFDVIAVKNKELFNAIIMIIEHTVMKKNNRIKIILLCRHYTYNLINKKSPYLYEFSFLNDYLKMNKLPAENLDRLTNLEHIFILSKYEQLIQLEKFKSWFGNELYNKMQKFVAAECYNDLLQIPIYFNIFLKYCKANNKIPITDIELIKEYIARIVYTSANVESVDKLFAVFINEFGKNDIETFVPRSKIIQSDIIKPKLYTELLFKDFIEEHKNINKSGKINVWVKIKNEKIYNYILSLSYCSADGKVTILIFDYLQKKVKHLYRLINIQRNLLKFAFINGQYDVIFNFKKILKNNFINYKRMSYSSEFYKLLLVIVHCVRFDYKAQRLLTAQFAKDADWQNWFFASLIDYDFFVDFSWSNYKLLLNESSPAMIFLANTMHLHKCILTKDFEQAEEIIKLNDSVNIDFEKFHPHNVGRWLSFKFLYMYISKSGDLNDILELVENYADMYKKSENYGHLVASLYVPFLMVFNNCSMHSLVMQYRQKVKGTHFDDYEAYSVSDYEIVPLLLADAYYGIGEYKKALNSYEQYTDYEYESLITIYKSSVDIKMLLIEQKYDEALQACKYLQLKAKIFKFDCLTDILESKHNQIADLISKE